MTNRFESQIVYCIDNEVLLKDSKIMHGYKIGQILYDHTNKLWWQLTARNPHVWTQVNSPLTMKQGRCEFLGTTLRGEGMMGDITNLGSSLSGNIMDGTGSCQTSFTGTASIRNAGFGILPAIGSDSAGLTRTNFLPYYIIKIVIPGRSSGDSRLYSGWVKNSTGPAVSDDPISNTQGGIIVGFNSTDTKFNIWNSNGDGVTAVTKTEMSNISAPTGFVQYKIEMIYTSSTTVIVNVYDSTFALLDTKTISTNTLAFGKSINWATVTQNPTQASKTITGYGAYMRALL